MTAPDEPEALERFHSALDIVDRIANQTVRSLGASVEKDELLSFGHEGLLDAARRFDSKRDVPFRAYATYRVHGAIYDGIRRTSRLSRKMHQKLAALEAARQVTEGEAREALRRTNETDAAVEAAFDRHLASVATAVSLRFASDVTQISDGEREPATTDPTAEEAYAKAELLSVVSTAIETLRDTERQILRRFYFNEEKMDDIAVSLKMHKSWVSRIHSRAIEQLSKRLHGAVG